MSANYELGDGPCQDNEDWGALLLFKARRALTPPRPDSASATLFGSPEHRAQQEWVGHALLQVAHDGICGCLEQHNEWLHEATRTWVAPAPGFGK